MARAVHALFLALHDLASPRVLRTLAQSLALTLLIFAVAGAAIFVGARWALDQWQWLDGIALDMASVLILLGLVLGAWLLFRAVAILVVGLFADAILADVEARHYPAAAQQAIDVGWRKSGTLALASLARLVAGNLLAAPFYILLLVTGIGTPLLVLGVNALLLGRDLDAMVGARHPDRPGFDRPARWSLGLLSAAAFLVPVVNLLAPIVSAAMAVHLFHLGHPKVKDGKYR